MYLSITKLSPAQVLEDGWRMSENQAFSEKEQKFRKMPTCSTSLTIQLCSERLPGHTAPFPARQRVYPMTVSKTFKTSVPQPHVPEGKKAKGPLRLVSAHHSTSFLRKQIWTIQYCFIASIHSSKMNTFFIL